VHIVSAEHFAPDLEPLFEQVRSSGGWIGHMLSSARSGRRSTWLVQ
jgi:hypothetical protein